MMNGGEGYLGRGSGGWGRDGGEVTGKEINDRGARNKVKNM